MNRSAKQLKTSIERQDKSLAAPQLQLWRSLLLARICKVTVTYGDFGEKAALAQFFRTVGNDIE
jgi:hypothetical protein